MQTPSTVAPDEAAELLEGVRAAREAADRRMAANWLSLVVAGALLIVTWVFFDAYDGGAVALYWVALAPLALLAARRYERMQLQLAGAVRSRRGYAVFAGSFIGSCVACGAAGAIAGEPDVITFGPLFGVACAYGFVAWKDRNRNFAAWALGLAVVASATVLLDAGHPARALALGIGGRLVLEGVAERGRRAG
jgi:FtsH-binding integral membrane protein